MSKIEKITKQLQHEQADAAWITTPLNVFYFTGYRSEPHERLFALLITANGDQTLYCPKTVSYTHLTLPTNREV